MKHGVRIIGGKYRGKKLSVPDSIGLRPTSDRMRETLFNWLMYDVAGSRCLDAFAGSGALGFEAFSRGAREVVMVERSARIAAQLQKTAAELAAKDILVYHQDVLKYLETVNQSFDIVFLDPPFAINYWQKCLHKLQANQLLAPDALVYIESPDEIQMDTQRWQCLKQKRAGQVFYALYKYRETDTSTAGQKLNGNGTRVC